jgi:hypothetical protein
MDNLNKLISFALGLVVVIVLLAFLSGKINIGKKINILGDNKTTTTPTPTPKKIITISNTNINQPTPTKTSEYHLYNSTSTTAKTTTKTTKEIPSTGLPTIVIPLLFSAFGVGALLRKKA